MSEDTGRETQGRTEADPRPTPIGELVAARKTAALTQAELGRRVYTRLHGEANVNSANAQYKISAFETGKLKPNDAEREAIAIELGRSLSEVTAWFGDATPVVRPLAPRVVGQLGKDQLMIVAAIGHPKVGNVPELPSTLASAVNEGLAAVFAIPYPDTAIKVVPEGPAEASLVEYQAGVLHSTLSHFNLVRSKLSQECLGELAVVAPRIPLSGHTDDEWKRWVSRLFPPIAIRYALIYTKTSAEPKRELYLWVRTQDINDLRLVEAGDQNDLAVFWERYFLEIVEAWMTHGTENFLKVLEKNSDSYWSPVLWNK